MFELCLAYTNIPTEKESCKVSPIEPDSPDSLKMIFAPLTEVIAVHMGLTIIYL